MSFRFLVQNAFRQRVVSRGARLSPRADHAGIQRFNDMTDANPVWKSWLRRCSLSILKKTRPGPRGRLNRIRLGRVISASLAGGNPAPFGCFDDCSPLTRHSAARICLIPNAWLASIHRDDLYGWRGPRPTVNISVPKHPTLFPTKENNAPHDKQHKWPIYRLPN